MLFIFLNGGNSKIRTHDLEVGAGTMSRAGAQCPCCPTIMGMEDIRYEGKNSRLGQVMTAVIVEGQCGKEYRLPTSQDILAADNATSKIESLFQGVPFGVPRELLVEDAKQNTWCVQYGQDAFFKLFNSRQLVSIGKFLEASRSISAPFSPEVVAYLCCSKKVRI